MMDYDAIIASLNEWEKKGKVVLMTCEGPMACDLEELISQPVEGLLYDLNRDEATTKTLMRQDRDLPCTRLINDYAVARVIRALHQKANKK